MKWEKLVGEKLEEFLLPDPGKNPLLILSKIFGLPQNLRFVSRLKIFERFCVSDELLKNS